MVNNNVRIIRIEGAEILKNNKEGREIKVEHGAVFGNSLLLNKLKELGLKVRDDKTNSIICVKFDYGYNAKEYYSKFGELKIFKEENTYKDSLKKEREKRRDLKKELNKKIEREPEVKALRKIIKDKKKKGEEVEKEKDNLSCLIQKLKEEKYREESEEIIKVTNVINKIMEEQEVHKTELEKEMDKYKTSIEKVREELYGNGFKLTLKNGRTEKEYEYVMWFRSSSKARVGDVIFLEKKLYEKVRLWQQMGIDFEEDEESMIVELGAYKALTSSTIESLVHINPKNILVVDDLISHSLEKNFANVVAVNRNGIKVCDVIYEKTRVKNTLFDGQALLDSEIFNGNGYSNSGMMLLRHHFFKACCFNTNIKTYMKDYCKDNGYDYETHTVKDRYGNDVYVKDILMITTENAMKWEKFFIDKLEGFKSWCKVVDDDECKFGIVKTDHISKFKTFQQLSYQIISTLLLNKEDMHKLADETLEYIKSLKEDTDKFISYLELVNTEFDCYEMYIDIYNKNKAIANTSWFRSFKSKTISKIVRKAKEGKLFIEGADYKTMVGNPFLMLKHAVGEVKRDGIEVLVIDNTLPIQEDGSITVYCNSFNDNEKLGGFRNPNCAINNVSYFTNVNKDNELKKYFNFNDNIVAINCINTDVQDRLSGCDFDSDQLLLTNNEYLVKATKKAYEEYETIINNIDPNPLKYKNNLKSYAEVDNKLQKGKFDIGRTSNFAMISTALCMDSTGEDKELYKSYAEISSTLSQLAIDSAKREFVINVSKELDRIRGEVISLSNGKAYKPHFWTYTNDSMSKETKEKQKEKTRVMNCPMDIAIKYLNKEGSNATTEATEKIDKYIAHIEKKKANNDQLKDVEELIAELENNISKEQKRFDDLISPSEEDKKEHDEKLFRLETRTLNKIQKKKITEKTLNQLIRRCVADKGVNSKIYSKRLLKMLYKTNTEMFIKQFKK